MQLSQVARLLATAKNRTNPMALFRERSATQGLQGASSGGSNTWHSAMLAAAWLCPDLTCTAPKLQLPEDCLALPASVLLQPHHLKVNNAVASYQQQANEVLD